MDHMTSEIRDSSQGARWPLPSLHHLQTAKPPLRELCVDGGSHDKRSSNPHFTPTLPNAVTQDLTSSARPWGSPVDHEWESKRCVGDKGADQNQCLHAYLPHKHTLNKLSCNLLLAFLRGWCWCSCLATATCGSLHAFSLLGWWGLSSLDDSL